MKNIIAAILSFFIILLLSTNINAEETHSNIIIAKILETKEKIVKANNSSDNDYIFLAFWDFDGTILKGDCTEGLQEDQKKVYKGLAQMAIEAGYSSIYPSKDGTEKFFEDYHHMEEKIGKWLAYPYAVQMLRGTPLVDIQELSKKHFNNVLRNYYFTSSVSMIKALKSNGIECHIISASADVFLDAAASTLGLDVGRFNGIEVQIGNGRLSEKLNYPVTWAEGKTEKLLSVIQHTAQLHPDKTVVVLAAFGNSFSTDGPFMKYVVMQTLPAGKPVSVMINGGEAPMDYQGLFMEVNQNEIEIETGKGK